MSAVSILFISPQPFLSNRGSPLRVLQTVSALTTLGFEVDLLAFPFGDPVSIPNLTVYRSGNIPGINSVPVGPSWRKIFLDGLLLTKATGLSRKKRYSVIHGIEEGAFMASLLARSKKIPYVADMHSLVPEHLLHSGFLRSTTLLRWFDSAYSRCLQKAGGIIAVSQELKDFADRIAPTVPCYPLEDIPIDTVSSVNDRLVQSLIDSHQLAGKKVILYTGNFEDYQGIDLLLHAMQVAFNALDEKKRKNIVLLLVGEHAATRIEHYRQLTATLGIDRQVIFTGERPREEMGSYMSLASVLVSPRTKGGNTPLKIYCYMATGIPIVATNISSHTQVLSSSSAFLAEPNHDSLGKTLLQALEDSWEAVEVKRSITAAAKAIIDNRFNKEAFTNQIARFYHAVLSDSAPLALKKRLDELPKAA